MNLKFNIQGDVETDEKGLLNASTFESEIARFAFFFDCERGDYLYNTTFGNNSDNLVGLSGVSEVDVQLFNEELNNYLEASGLLLSATVAADFVDDQTIEVTIIGTSGDYTYRYSTTKGRLYSSEVEGPAEEYNYMIHSEDITVSENLVIDISGFIKKLKEVNNIGKYEELELSYRLLRIADGVEGDVIGTENYAINIFEETLTLMFNYTQGEVLRLQGWPTNMAALESTDNPYLLRRNL